MTTDEEQAPGEPRPDRVVEFGPFRLEAARRLLLEDGKPLQIGSRAFDLLVALTAQAGEVVGNRELITSIWPGTFVEDGNLRVHVGGLRKALRDGQDGRRYIVNSPGRGYSFVAPLREVVQAVELPTPAPASAAPASSLPRALTRLVGRADLLDMVSQQLAQRRFVTLVGPGGIGKTTAALAIAHRLAALYPDGACFVDLSTTRDAALVPGTIAAALGLGVPDRDAMPAVTAHLGARRMLLVLDNCEHVVAAAADAAEVIVTAVPQSHLLATSREPLRAAGERVHRLAPLELPPATPGLTASEAMTFSCIQLFAERVSAAVAGFSLNDADAPVVAEICRKLDGIPLAVELAAARVAALGIRELASRLDDRFRLLTSGRRTALPRQQTLAATLDWSHELLPPDEQVLLRRLAVFAGPFSLDGAVAAMVEPQRREGVVGAIGNLVEKSLVVVDLRAGAGRYRLLETTRLYAAEKLRGDPMLAQVCRAHAGHMCGLFAAAEADAASLPPHAFRARYAEQLDNLRKALDWSGGPGGDPELYVALCLVAVPLWVQLSLMAECRGWVERGLAMLQGDARPALDARMRLMAARSWSLMYAAGRASDIGEAWSETLRLAQALGDVAYELRAIWGVWIGKLNRGELDATLTLAQRLLDLVEGSTNQTDLMMADRLMATTLHFRGDQNGARTHIERMLGRHALAPAQPRLVRFQVDQSIPAGYFRARILWLQGFPDLATQAVARNIEEGEALGQALSFGSVLGQGACPIALLTGDLPAARRYGALLLDHSARHALHLWHGWARCFLGLVAVHEGSLAEGLAAMAAVFEEAGDNRFLPRYMLLLAHHAGAAGCAGDAAQGVATLDAMLARCARSSERWYEPELIRLRAELLLRAGAPDGEASAAADFSRAMELAAQQGARSWQLRAAMSLARLRSGAGDRAGARGALEPVYAAFTEGWESADLIQAAALLAAL